MKILKSTLAFYREAYSGLPGMAWMLSGVEFVNRSGTMVLFFMTLYLTQKMGFSPARAGQAISIYGLGALIGAYLGGKLSDMIGPIRVLNISLVLAGTHYLVLAKLHDFRAILAVMFMLGLLTEAEFPANSTAMSHFCPPELRTRGFALRRLATNLGITIGPALGGTLAMINYQWLFLVDGLTCFAAAGVLMVAFRKKTGLNFHRKNRPVPARSIRKDVFFLRILFMLFLIGLIHVQIFNAFPLYLRLYYHLPENRIGFLLAINTVLIVLFEMVLIHALRNKPLHRIIAFGILLFGSGFSLLPFGRGFWFAAFTILVWTIGEMLSMPTLTALIANHAEDVNRGRYLGISGVAFSLALLVGPFLGAMVFQYLGPDILWMAIGLLALMIFSGFRFFMKSETRLTNRNQ